MRFAPLKSRRGLFVVALLSPVLLAVIGLFSLANVPTGGPNGQPALAAALVNEDEIVYEGKGKKKTPVAAGRLLVGELVTSDASGFDWTITDASVAERGLRDGQYAAVVTIPKNFSAAYISSGSANPQQATLEVKTDGANSYLAAVLAAALSETLANELSTQFTNQFIDQLLLGYSAIGENLKKAAGAEKALASGLGELAKVTNELPAVTRELATGSETLAEGNTELALGLEELAALSQKSLSTAVELELIYEELRILIRDRAPWSEIDAKFEALKSKAKQLGTETLEVDIGVDIAALVADELVLGSDALAEGSKGLAEGMPLLRSGIDGAALGSKEIAKALGEAGKAIPEYSTDAATQLAKVASTPITTEVTTAPALPPASIAIAAIIVPLALWLGALMLSLVFEPFQRKALASRASTLRIVFGAALPLVAVAVLQGGLLLGTMWLAGLRPVHHTGTIGLVLVASVAFVLIYQGLAALAGKYAWLISVGLLSLQVAAAGVLLPLSYAAKPLQSLGDILPLSVSIRAAQELMDGGTLSHGIAATVVVAIGGLTGLVLLAIAVSRGRLLRAAPVSRQDAPSPLL